MLDATVGETDAERAILNRLPSQLPCIRVVNKIDLNGSEPGVVREGEGVTVRLSALTGAGVEGLRDALLELAGWQGAEEGLFLARARHLQALEQARACLGRAQGLSTQLELFAEELRLAQEALGAITGQFTSDDLLGEIFARFCVGK
jgi:tRNA modification GTPase